MTTSIATSQWPPRNMSHSCHFRVKPSLAFLRPLSDVQEQERTLVSRSRRMGAPCEPGAGPNLLGSIRSPSGCTFDATGRYLIIAEQNNHRLQVLEPWSVNHRGGVAEAYCGLGQGVGTDWRRTLKSVPEVSKEYPAVCRADIVFSGARVHILGPPVTGALPPIHSLASRVLFRKEVVEVHTLPPRLALAQTARDLCKRRLVKSQFYLCLIWLGHKTRLLQGALQQNDHDVGGTFKFGNCRIRL